LRSPGAAVTTSAPSAAKVTVLAWAVGTARPAKPSAINVARIVFMAPTLAARSCRALVAMLPPLTTVQYILN
jgi:hypothetical protein